MGNIPGRWTTCTLGDIVEVVGGGTPARSNASFWGGPIRWATPTDVTGLRVRRLNATRSTITESGLAASSARVLPAGTVLMTSRATIGACAIADVSMATNQGFQNLVPGPDVHAEYLYYLAQSLRPELERLASGSTFREVSRASVSSVPVLLPPQVEQRGIAVVLAAVDDAIAAGEAVVEQLDLVRRDLAEDLLRHGLPGRHDRMAETPLGSLPAGWAVSPLGELAEVERGKFTHRPRGDPRLYGGRYPFIQTGDVTACGGQITTFNQTLNEEGLAVSRLFPAGTVVVTIAANIGETGVAEFEVAFPDSLVGVRCGPRLHNRYLELALRARKRELSNSAPQSAQKNINLETLRPLLIPVPPIDEQESIARAAASVTDRLAAERAVVVERRRLKVALADALLTGEIRVPMAQVV